MNRQRRITLFGLAIFSIIALHACEESGADDLIRLTPRPDILSLSYVNADSVSQVQKQEKAVLVEDFTGSSCPNCPDAADKIKDIKKQFGDRVIAMAIHAGAEVFVAPSEKSKYDFRTTDADALYNLLGQGALPVGAVDRVLYDGESVINHDRFLWLEHARSRIEDGSQIPLNIDIDILERTPEQIQFAVRVFYHTDVVVEDEQDKHYLSVYLAEDSIVDYQKFPGPAQEDYVHNHVLRTLVTNNTTGDLLDESLVQGRVFVRRFTVDIKQDDPDAAYKTGWKSDHLHVIALVHQVNGRDFDVIHVRESAHE